MLHHCDYRLFLAFNNSQIIGRIAAYVNHSASQYWQKKIGFFGHYESINCDEAAFMLLKAAENWLRDQGMDTMYGQWNLVSQDIGFIKEGFEVPPIVMSSYNYPYYNDQMTRFGMKKVKDLLVYSRDTGDNYKIPDRFLRFTDRIAQRYRVKVRKLNMKELVKDTRILVNLTNEALRDNWGYYPVAESEADEIAADLRMVVDPEIVLIAEVDDKPIGYVITLPDINHLLKGLKGRLFPWGLFKLITGLKKVNRFRIWAMGILPEYQKKGISVLLFRRLNDILTPQGAYVEINWILEDNSLMNNAITKLKFDLVKRYRIYKKRIVAK